MIDYDKLQKAIAGGIFTGMFMFALFAFVLFGLLGAMVGGAS